MSVKAIGSYDFPSRSRQELYGDDQLVHVWWRNNPFMSAAGTFRAPKAMPWSDFRAALLDPWAGTDPDFDPAAPGSWTLDGQPITPTDDQTLEQLGVGHKSLISFAA
ncbi:MAG: phenol hydroxylase subunit [Frankiales bacterium]|jgi:phenol hydroxylase P4 protein|nr:phenol hydroxylase subunit [Frankiales bacterium]